MAKGTILKFEASKASYLRISIIGEELSWKPALNVTVNESMFLLNKLL